MNPYQTPYNYQQRYNQNGITWVQGIEGAKAFQLYPNSNILLMDSEDDRFFIKTCDEIGMCNLRVFKYEEIQETTKPASNNIDMSQYVTRQELEELLGGIINGKQTIPADESE